MNGEQVLFSLPLERLEPIFKTWLRQVLTEETTSKQATPPPSQSEPQRIYGDDALSKYIGVSVLTIRKMKSKLPRYRTGRKYYYLTNEIDDFFRVNVPKRFQPKVKQG